MLALRDSKFGKSIAHTKFDLTQASGLVLITSPAIIEIYILSTVLNNPCTKKPCTTSKKTL